MPSLNLLRFKLKSTCRKTRPCLEQADWYWFIGYVVGSSHKTGGVLKPFPNEVAKRMLRGIPIPKTNERCFPLLVASRIPGYKYKIHNHSQPSTNKTLGFSGKLGNFRNLPGCHGIRLFDVVPGVKAGAGFFSINSMDRYVV